MEAKKYKIEDKKIIKEWEKVKDLRDKIIAKADEAMEFEKEMKKLQGLIDNRKAVLSPMVYKHLGDKIGVYDRLGDISADDKGDVYINVFDMVEEYKRQLEEKHNEWLESQKEDKKEDKS